MLKQVRAVELRHWLLIQVALARRPVWTLQPYIVRSWYVILCLRGNFTSLSWLN